MIEATHPTSTRGPDPGDMFAVLADSALLESPGGREIVARLDAATDSEYPRRRLHVRSVALVVLRAKGFA